MHKARLLLFFLFSILLVSLQAPCYGALELDPANPTFPPNNAVGVPPGSSFTATFTTTLSDPFSWWSQHISDYVTLEKIKDNAGNPLDPPLSISISTVNLTTGDLALSITPESSLSQGSTYKVTLGTLIKNLASESLPAPYTFSFVTQWDSSATNSLIGADGKVKVHAPFNTLLEDGYIEIIEDPLNDTVISTPATIQSANTDIRDPANLLRYPILSTMKEFNLYTGYLTNSTFESDEALNQNAAGELPQITLSYQDTDNDGIIDDTSDTASPVLENSIAIYRLNIETNTWEKLGGAVDKTNNTITVQTNRLTVFVIMGSVYEDVHQAYAYPVPFTATKNPNHTEITFTNLAPNSTIKIYTIAGSLVKELTADSLGSNVQWNTLNDSNSKTASGVYLYIISSSSNTKSGKLIIIR